MKRRLLVLALLAAPLAVRAQPADWQTVVGRDLRFRLEMPAPVTETKATETEKGHAEDARRRTDAELRRAEVAALVGRRDGIRHRVEAVQNEHQRTSAWVPITIGGAMAVVGYLAAALDQHAFAILFASVMIGGCYAFMHSTMQAWATDIAPEVRGTAAALFVTSAFTGGAIGSGVGALLAQQRHFGDLFLVAVALSVPVVIVAALSRARYPGSTLAVNVGEVAGS